MKRNYSSVLESEVLEATWWIGHEWVTEKQQIHTSQNMFPKTVFPPRCFTNKSKGCVVPQMSEI